MKANIIRDEDTLRQAIWIFNLHTFYSAPVIYLDSYSLMERRSLRHKWRRIRYWDRLEKRYNTISDPPLPADVEAEMRADFKLQIEIVKVVR